MSTTFAWSLPPQAVAVPRSRAELRRRCSHLPEPALDDVLLLSSELVTNAILHGAGEVTCRLWSSPEKVRLEVTDDSTDYPVETADGTEAVSGRGLTIVNALASRWGATPACPGGKTVWFELDTPTM